MEFRILGPLEVHRGGGPLRVPGAKERALLADLLVHAGQMVPADRLVEDLWGEEPPGNPANTLQGRVSALRRALGPAGAELVPTSPPGYRLAVEPERVDAARFQRLVAEADAAAATERPRAARLLEEALALWRGPALAEFADRPWAAAEAARLEELRLAAQEALVDLRLAGGGHAELAGELEALVAAHPLRERLRGQLMLALYRSAARPTPCGSTPRPAPPWPRSWASTPRPSSSGSSGPSSPRTRPSPRPNGRPPPRRTTCPSGSPAWSAGTGSSTRWPSWWGSTGW